MKRDSRQLIGGEEWCALPDLGIPFVKSRVDSGARTSALHAWNIKRFQRGGHDWVAFRAHPLQRDRRTVLDCEAELVDQRAVKSSSGVSERRYVIRTTLALGGLSFPIELTLTTRDSMGYRMLLGREAMSDRLLVDPSVSFVCPAPSSADLAQAYQDHRLEAPHISLGILASSGCSFATELGDIAQDKGHFPHLVDPADCVLDYESHDERLICVGVEHAEHLDAVLSLAPREDSDTASTLLRHFEHRGAYNPNPARALHEFADRFRAYQKLVRSAVNLPPTRWAPSFTGSLAEPFAKKAVIVRGGSAEGALYLARHARSRSGAMSLPGGAKAPVLVQGLPPRGRLMRCFVAGTKVLAMPLTVTEAGTLEIPEPRLLKLSTEARAAVRLAVRTLGVKLAAVDIVYREKTALVLEVDPFGFTAIPASNARGRFIAAVVRLVERAVVGASRSSA